MVWSRHTQRVAFRGDWYVLVMPVFGHGEADRPTPTLWAMVETVQLGWTILLPKVGPALGPLQSASSP